MARQCEIEVLSEMIHGIRAVKFSSDRKYIALAGEPNDQEVAIWKCESQVCVSSSTSVFNCLFIIEEIKLV